MLRNVVFRFAVSTKFAPRRVFKSFLFELLVSDYFEQAEESKVDTLYLPGKEFDLLLDLSKTVEISAKMPIANSGMWVH